MDNKVDDKFILDLDNKVDDKFILDLGTEKLYNNKPSKWDNIEGGIFVITLIFGFAILLCMVVRAVIGHILNS